MKNNEDKVFLKTKKDGLWETNPHIAFTLFLIGGILLLGAVIFIFGFFPFNAFVIVISELIIMIGITLLSIKINNDRNISKSIAFIKRNNKWYAIKLMYDSSLAGDFIYMPSGSAGQVITNKHNANVASNIQNMEQQIKNIRTQKEAYINALDDVLLTLEKGEAKPHLYSNGDKKIDYLLNGYAFEEIHTINNKLYGYLILNNLKIEKINQKYITISFDGDKGIRRIMKFRNVYDGLIDEMQK